MNIIHIMCIMLMSCRNKSKCLILVTEAIKVVQLVQKWQISCIRRRSKTCYWWQSEMFQNGSKWHMFSVPKPLKFCSDSLFLASKLSSCSDVFLWFARDFELKLHHSSSFSSFTRTKWHIHLYLHNEQLFHVPFLW